MYACSMRMWHFSYKHFYTHLKLLKQSFTISFILPCCIYLVSQRVLLLAIRVFTGSEYQGTCAFHVRNSKLFLFSYQLHYFFMPSLTCSFTLSVSLNLK